VTFQRHAHSSCVSPCCCQFVNSPRGTRDSRPAAMLGSSRGLPSNMYAPVSGRRDGAQRRLYVMWPCVKETADVFFCMIEQGGVARAAEQSSCAHGRLGCSSSRTACAGTYSTPQRRGRWFRGHLVEESSLCNASLSPF
jgi:hypothetical protein